MEKIDMVFILGGGSRWGNNEIRYSLRSVEQFFPAVGKVFVVGECPEWMTNVIHIKAPDQDKNKLLNAKNKYLAAANDMRVSKNFVLMNDDFFFLKRTEDIKNFSRGTIEQMLELHPSKSGYYFRSLYDTNKRLNTMGIPNAIDFEIHAPIIFNKEKLISVIGMIGNSKAYSIRSCYGNLMNIEPTLMTDFKAANLAEFLAQMKRTDAHFLSINDALVANDSFRKWISEMYPIKSKYEIHDDDLKILPGRAVSCRRYHAKRDFRYGGKLIQKGCLISKEIIEQIKNSPKMKLLWEWK